mgnify:CR=1 FL=1
MSKVLHIRMDAPTYSSDGMEQGFKDAGFEYDCLYWQQIKFNEGVESLRKRMIKRVSETLPDIIFLHIQSEGILDEATIYELNKYCFTVLFTEDVREEIWQEKLLPELGLMIFTNKDAVEKLERKGFVNVAYMPTSYNHLIYKKGEPSGKDYGEIIFIGNNYADTNLKFPKAKHRADMVYFMEQTFGDRFKAYGRGFKNQMLKPEQEIDAYRSCKIAITHNNFYRKGYCSDRSFRAVGTGAFTLHEYYEGIESNFIHLNTWSTFDQLKRLCVSALNNDYIRNKIALEENNNCIKNNTWSSRFKTLKKLINEQHARA